MGVNVGEQGEEHGPGELGRGREATVHGVKAARDLLVAREQHLARQRALELALALLRMLRWAVSRQHSHNKSHSPMICMTFLPCNASFSCCV